MATHGTEDSIWQSSYKPLGRGKGAATSTEAMMLLRSRERYLASVVNRSEAGLPYLSLSKDTPSVHRLKLFTALDG